MCMNLNLLQPRMLRAKIGWNRHMEKGVVLHLNKLESPLPKDALSQDWLKLAQWFWRKRFVCFVNVFLLFRYYLLESPLPSGFFSSTLELRKKLKTRNLGNFSVKQNWEKFKEILDLDVGPMQYQPQIGS